MKSKLFTVFEPVSSQAWKQLIQKDLKGADYNKTLVWESLEGIHVKPIYHKDETEYLQIPQKQGSFKIAEAIPLKDLSQAVAFASESVKNGVDFLIFKSGKPFAISELMKEISHFKSVEIIFDIESVDEVFIQELTSATSNQSVKILIDPIGNLLRDGSWFNNEEDIAKALDLVKNNQNVALKIDATIFQNAGANLVQQIAYTLSYLMEYANKMDKESSNIPVFFAMGNNYFFEIAKLRSFRYLWHQIKSELDLKIDISLFTLPSMRNKTLKDYHNNILRASTELMSGVLGGADVCMGMPYDVLFNDKNTTSSRTARNQLNILKEEVSFSSVDTITEGTYYIEEISVALAKKSLELFKIIDDKGGLLTLFYKGKLQEKIKQSATKEQTFYDEGKIVLVGSNKYILKDEESPKSNIKSQNKKTSFESIPKRILVL